VVPLAIVKVALSVEFAAIVKLPPDRVRASEVVRLWIDVAPVS
jgi:hypothetical protein